MTAQLPLGDTHVATLAHEGDWAGFRREARRLLAQGVPPGSVAWEVRHGGPAQGEVDQGPLAAGEGAGSPGEDDERPACSQPGPVVLRIPPGLLALAQTAALHTDPARWSLLYRVLWRWGREPGLRHDSLDADMVRLRLLERAVSRDLHKMKAFVRFKVLADGLHVAWFEPEHHILGAVAPFFIRRFANMQWAILTPQGSIAWDGARLAHGAAASRTDVPEDDSAEALWRTYYASIFNPARLKLATMCREMPRRYWVNLPEARLIAPLTAGASVACERMVAQAPSLPEERIRWRVAPPPIGPVPPSASHPAMALDPDAPPTLPDLAQEAMGCRRCPLWQGATQTVFGEGDARARLMVVGEQPGDQEDLAGRPFVGPAGQLLERAMADLGWPREAVYITNAVKHFKYELRGRRRIHKTPGQREAAACQYWLDGEIATVQPQAIVALGATATHSLLGASVGVLANRGQWLARPDGRRVLVTLHPSALLRMPAAEKLAAYRLWLDDLQHATELVA